MKTLALLAVSTLVSLATAACSGAPAPETSSQNSSAVHVNDPAADLAGTWVFDLDRSEVAVAIKDDCAKKSGGDSAKQAACWNEIHEEAGREKIRFSKADESGRSTWTSFGLDDGSAAKEIVFLELPVELASDGQGHVLAKIAGKATGMQAEHFAKSNTNQMRIEVVDAKTIAMSDPKKGRLVFTKEER